MPELDYRQKAWSIGLIVLFFAGWELFCLMTGMSDLVLPRFVLKRFWHPR